MEPIAVTGVGIVSPIGCTFESFGSARYTCFALAASQQAMDGAVALADRV